MQYNKKKMLIDVDDVIVDNAFLEAINKFKGTNYKDSDFEEYFIDDVVMNDADKANFRKYMLENNIYKNCRLVEGAKETLDLLKDFMDIYICSACVVRGLEKYSGIFFARKYDFLLGEFPYLDPNKIIFTGNKNYFTGFDYQVDDRMQNLEGDIPHKLLFTRHHNKNIEKSLLTKKGITRVDNWSDILEYIMCM